MSQGLKQPGKPRTWLRPLITATVILGIGLLLVTNTTVVTAEQSEEVAIGLNPSKNFSPADFADEAFPAIESGIKEQATELAVIDAAVADDPTSAVAQFGQDLGAGSFVFPVTANATVDSVDDKFIYLNVEGIAGETQVLIPIASALNGGPVRDSTGIVAFGDVPDQIAFQTVAQEIKNMMIATALDPLDISALPGKQIVVYGAWKNGGPKNTFIIQPTEVTVLE